MVALGLGVLDLRTPIEGSPQPLILTPTTDAIVCLYFCTELVTRTVAAARRRDDRDDRASARLLVGCNDRYGLPTDFREINNQCVAAACILATQDVDINLESDLAVEAWRLNPLVGRLFVRFSRSSEFDSIEENGA